MYNFRNDYSEAAHPAVLAAIAAHNDEHVIGYGADANIRTHTLLQALQSPLFTAYKEGQPWSENHLRPCPLLDNPQALVDAVERSGARSTDLQSPEEVRDLAAKCEEAAENWAPVADEIWARAHGCASCRACEAAGPDRAG